MNLTLGSLFDGSGGFPLAGILAGVEPVWSSEVSPFPILVTHKRLPQVKHYGDVSKLNGGNLEAVDIITFGSPCQDMSVAGKRAGLDGARSGLFHQAIRIIKEMREATNGRCPRYAVWENVTGAFSSNKGNDFKAVLEAFISVKEEGVEVPAPEKGRWAKADVLLGDGWSVAYRTFDSQYWGVPQRRSRIYLVADFAGESAGEILFKSEGLSGYSSEGFRAWQKAANSFETGIGTSGGTICANSQCSSSLTITKEQTGTLVAQDHGNHPAVLQPCDEISFALSDRGDSSANVTGTLRTGVNKTLCLAPTLSVEHNPTDSRIKISEDGKVQTLCNRMSTGGGNVPLVAEPITAFGICAKGSNAMQSDNPNSGFYEATTSRTLDANGGNSLCSNQGGIAVVEAYKLCHNQAQKIDVSTTLDCSIGHLSSQQGGTAVVNTDEIYDVRFTSEGTKNARGHCYKTDTSRCLDTGGEDPSGNHGGLTILAIQGSMIGRDNENGPNGSGINEDVSFTLNTTDRHAVAMPDEVSTYASTVGSFMHAEKEKANTLMARDYKDPQIVNDNKSNDPAYIVRRLTPTECARLQGFPDWWCKGLEIPNPSDEEIAFWMNVWAEWNAMNGKKPKTENQVRKWLLSPYSDVAEYAIWGNGVSLPIVFFVLSGIEWAYSKGL